MTAVNSLHLIGRVVREPQVFPRDNGAKSVLFTLAVNSGRKDANGQDVADFIEVSGYVSGTNPTRIYDYVHAKDLVAVECRVQSYKDKDNHTQVSFPIRNIEFLAKYKGTKQMVKPNVNKSTASDYVKPTVAGANA